MKGFQNWVEKNPKLTHVHPTVSVPVSVVPVPVSVVPVPVSVVPVPKSYCLFLHGWYRYQ